MVVKIPIRYLPKSLSFKDKKKQIQMLNTSKKEYKKGKFYTRKKLDSFPHKVSKHILKARKIYNVSSMTPSRELSIATGCSIESLKKIVQKGEGAYYSSGSRPNQTPQSWGLARLASSITSGKSASIDYDILDKGCNHKKKAYRLALLSRKKYKTGHSHTKRIKI